MLRVERSGFGAFLTRKFLVLNGRVWLFRAYYLTPYAPSNSGCLIADISMPDMDGLELLQELVNRRIRIPVIVITGHGGVPMAVRAMRPGAVDFVEKPFDDEVLMESVRRGFALAGMARRELQIALEAEQRIATLSEREREVLERLVTGRPNKIVAFELDISPRTVEVSRARVMKKMQARSLSDLVRQALALGIGRSFQD